MKDLTGLFYFLDQPEQLYHSGKINQIVHTCIQRGYFLVTSQEQVFIDRAWALHLNPDWSAWRDLSSEEMAEHEQQKAQAIPYLEHIFTPGVSAQLQQEIERFTAHQQQSLSFDAESVAASGPLHRFNFTVDLSPEGDGLLVTYFAGFFSGKVQHQERVQAFDHWLEIIILFYDTFQPFYVYALDFNNPALPTEERALEQRKPSLLYNINLFGPEMVENLGGREYVLRTPAQIVRPLDDGGMLVIPRASFYAENSQHSFRKAATYLGLDCPEYIPEEDSDEEE